ncbi:MAG: nucleotidyl transferase AbiEii/AbiGii toxin family protein [Syntrophorhabdaceae bacterium]|nr:nucleotidyl transferase AbiEii/AbiGii toxin family protein [Syntrophorhabdaceae bacterium]
MGVRSFDEGRIKSAEVIQLITLYNLFSRKEGKNIIFQGGTALRWFHGNERFSEDLDFVTSLDMAQLPTLLNSLAVSIEAGIKAQFGPGTFTLRNKERGRGGSLTAFVEFSSERQRGKTMVKLEFEKLKAGASPGQEQVILSSAPAVSYFIRTGQVMLPPGRVINVETVAEIFSDKIRALLERRYLKGRDLYDIWFMTEALRIAPDIGLAKRKLEMYEHPFALARKPEYFPELAQHPEGDEAAKAREEIDRDLGRFIHEDVMNVLRKDGFQPIFAATGDTFERLLKDGLDLTGYQAINDGRGTES